MEYRACAEEIFDGIKLEKDIDGIKLEKEIDCIPLKDIPKSETGEPVKGWWRIGW
jgi:hypothetical protein